MDHSNTNKIVKGIVSLLPRISAVEVIEKNPSLDLLKITEDVQSMLYKFQFFCLPSNVIFSKWSFDPLFQILYKFTDNEYLKTYMEEIDIRNLFDKKIYDCLVDSRINKYHSMLIRNLAILDFLGMFCFCLRSFTFFNLFTFVYQIPTMKKEMSF